MKSLVAVLCLGLVLGLVGCQLLAGAPSYTETSFEVPPGQKYTLATELKAGDILEGSFSVSGAENYIDFYVKGPRGELTYGVVRSMGSQSFEVKAESRGTYTLYFDNSFSFGSPRRISLRYIVR